MLQMKINWRKYKWKTEKLILKVEVEVLICVELSTHRKYKILSEFWVKHNWLVVHTINKTSSSAILSDAHPLLYFVATL